VRAAIDKVLTAQMYGAGSRRTQYADLRALMELEKQILLQMNQSSAGSVSIGVRIPAV
jgi:hypothetical protein